MHSYIQLFFFFFHLMGSSQLAPFSVAMTRHYIPECHSNTSSEQCEMHSQFVFARVQGLHRRVTQANSPYQETSWGKKWRWAERRKWIHMSGRRRGCVAEVLTVLNEDAISGCSTRIWIGGFCFTLVMLGGEENTVTDVNDAVDSWHFSSCSTWGCATRSEWWCNVNAAMRSCADLYVVSV